MKLKYLGVCDYQTIHQQMVEFTQLRDSNTEDEIWILQHHPVYTLGQAGKREHILSNELLIPVVNSDRGGQVTYHGPGQLIAYCLIDLRRKDFHIKGMVNRLEQSVIDFVATMGIDANRINKAPGVYVNGSKIAAVGLRIKQHCSYHGISFNINMDLTPFSQINPCGYPGLEVTQLIDLKRDNKLKYAPVEQQFAEKLASIL